MNWSPEATGLLNEYLDELHRICAMRGLDPAGVVSQVNERVLNHVRDSGVAEVSGDLIRGILAVMGSASSLAPSAGPPPLPREPVYLNPIEQSASFSGGGRQVRQQSSNSSRGCIVAAVIVGGLFFFSALIGAIMLPALARAREAARRATCQNNMKSIGLELQRYADAHGGAYPPLVKEEGYLIFGGDIAKGLDTKLFQCPSEDTDFSGHYDDGTIDLDSDYLYLGYAIHNQAELDAVLRAFQENGTDLDVLMSLGRIAGPDGDIVPLRTDLVGADSIPVLVEWTENHESRGASVLFLDGHVEFIKPGDRFPVTDAFYTVVDELVQ